MPGNSHLGGKSEHKLSHFYPQSKSYWVCLGTVISSVGVCFLFVSVNNEDPNYKKSRKNQFKKKSSKHGFIFKTLYLTVAKKKMPLECLILKNFLIYSYKHNYMVNRRLH